ncbi:hypothetical protein [Microbacterium sp. XT11]|uniref:hypothetical protein n=1 Tax=Microbacterium sp. XT11 TaxID=367477 RepID=UPI00082A9820|nr:hypothetical protein [Microbacterium sp. XT11]
MNLGTLPAFVAKCTALDVPVPSPITRALELLQVVEAHQMPPVASVLGMSDDEARAHVEALSIRQHTTGGGTMPGLLTGITDFRAQLEAEVREASLPELEGLVETLQPRFAELAAPLVTAAQEYGFTSATTSDQVIELADEKASAAWRAARRAWSAISPIVALRIEISKVFTVSPTREEMEHHVFPRRLGSMPVNYSAAFAEGENWSLEGGYYLEGKTIGHLDWLALAAGGLRLNTPAETAEKIAARQPRSLTAALAAANNDDAPTPTYPRG